MKTILHYIQNFSIKQKLILLGFGNSFIAVILTCIGFALFTVNEERQDLIEDLALISNILEEELTTELKNKDYGAISKSLDLLRGKESIIKACVFDKYRKEAGKFIRKKEQHGNCDDKFDSQSTYHFYSNVFVYKAALGEYGKMYIMSDLRKIKQKNTRFLSETSVFFLLISIIAYFISKILQKHISEPIMHLANISRQVQSGDYDIRAAFYYNDEIGFLTTSFNKMLSQIKNSNEKLESTVTKRTADLIKALQIKSDFLSNMSHEIRTPVHGIMNYADFLVKDWDELEQKERYKFVQKIYHNSGRLLFLINNLLDLSKLEAGKIEFHFAPANLVEMTQYIIQECEPLFENRKDIVINFDYNPDINLEAKFDKERIMQVISNLITNAIKFTPQGLIKIHISKDRLGSKKALHFSIVDDGIGIPEHELFYIFDKFNQGTNTKSGAGGTGLGLSICREIIRVHKGKIWAENNHGSGSIFHFVIPE